jgi:2'-5' RNA ligase
MRAADLSAGTLPMPQVAKGAIETVTLYRSDLSGERPRYEALHVVRLQAPPDQDWEGNLS